MNSSILSRLIKLDLFKDFDEQKLGEILQRYRTPVIVHQADHLVMLRGDEIESLLVLIGGQLRAQIQGLNGKNLRIEVLRAPQPVASGILFSDDNRLPVSLYAETDIEILSIPKKAVLDLCSASQSFMEGYFVDMGNKITILAEKIRLYQFNTIRQKIAGYILGLSGERKLRVVKFVYGREVLAELMSVTRPALSRELSALVHEGIISVKGRSVEIVDRQALVEIITG